MGERAEHTPGPWSMEGPDPFGDYNIHEPTARLAIGAVVSNLRSPKVVEANARLIAAAPDLLEALATCQKALAMMIEPKSISATSPQCAWAAAVEAETKARAAISRTTGEA